MGSSYACSQEVSSRVARNLSHAAHLVKTPDIAVQNAATLPSINGRPVACMICLSAHRQEDEPA
jgi:hypothetical protein